jgi:hypothetical protein
LREAWCLYFVTARQDAIALAADKLLSRNRMWTSVSRPQLEPRLRYPSAWDIAMTTVQWTAIVLLTPFWWAMGLSILALLGDLFPSWRRRVSPLFAKLDQMAMERSRDSVDRVAA